MESRIQRQRDAAAMMAGDRRHEDEFGRKFNDLAAARRDAETEGDEDDVCKIEARLNRLTGVPYPRPPDCYWEAADTMSAVRGPRSRIRPPGGQVRVAP